MAFNGRTPAQYVEHLISPGIPTVAGPVPLAAYVSTSATRFARANAVLGFFNQFLSGFSNSTADYTIDPARRGRPARPYPGARQFAVPIVPEGPVADGLNELEQMYQRIVSRGGPERPSNWRRVFSGQGTVDSVSEVMDFIVEHRDMLRAVVARGGTSPFAPYLDGPPQAALRGMVADRIFGLDCLGFVGTYLVYCGVEARYPECTQEQYLDRLGFRPVDSLDEIDARCVVVWLDGVATRHIGIIDSVTARSPQRISVDLCQSSAGGPQTNRGVRLERTPEFYTGALGPYRKFRITGGVPGLPVAGLVEVGKRARW
jgi:hypothetical protein